MDNAREIDFCARTAPNRVVLSAFRGSPLAAHVHVRAAWSSDARPFL